MCFQKKDQIPNFSNSISSTVDTPFILFLGLWSHLYTIGLVVAQIVCQDCKSKNLYSLFDFCKIRSFLISFLLVPSQGNWQGDSKKREQYKQC